MRPLPLLFLPTILAAAPAPAATASAPPPPPAPFESFENGVGPRWKAHGGAIAAVTGSARDGVKALRWNFSPGDTLEFRTDPFGPVNVWTGYGGYMRSSLDLYLRFQRPGPGKIVIEILSGDTTAGVIEVPLAYAHWQHLVYHHSWNSAIAWKRPDLKSNLDGLRFRAADTAPGSALLLDAIHCNRTNDWRDARNAITKPWRVPEHDFSKEPPVSPEELARANRLFASLSPAEDKSKKRDHWERTLKNFRAAADSRNYRPGRALTGGLVPLLQLLNDIAGSWAACPEKDLKADLAKEFIAIQDWAQDQGLVTDGALGVANNYIGRYYVDAVFKIAPALAAAGKLDDALAYLKWSYGYDARLFAGDGAGGESMDYFHNEAFRLLRIALMHGDPVERARHVRRFRLVLSNQLAGSVKPDGSLHHHGFHYFAYGTMGMNSVSGLLATLSAADTPVSERALDAAKLGVMRMRWYAGGDGVLLSLCGRHPSGRQALAADTFLNLARAYSPYRGGKPDAELLAAYLRLNPAAAGKPEFAGARAEAAPEGFVAMPYAGLGLFRYEHWLAGVKGYGRDIASGESYANANRFGLWLSNGFLALLTDPEPLPNVIGSGCRPDEGWNWNALDGATTIHAPLAKIANGNGTRSEQSDRTFVGGLAHGAVGVFAQDIRSSLQASACGASEPFVARKSWFFLDKRIVCLGSGITAKGSPYPVRTTLFQKFLDDAHPAALAGDETLKKPADATPLVRDLPPQTVLRDPYGNAYLSRNPAHLTVGEQLSRNGYDTADTKGAYATAWLDHGENPADAGYDYLVVVRASPEDLAAIKEGRTGVRTLRRDNAAHVVEDTASARIGYAIFDGNADLAALRTPLLGAAGPALVMLDRLADGGLSLSLTHPAPRPAATSPAPVSVRLAGRFALRAPIPAGASADIVGEETRLTVAILHGESVTVSLAAK